MLKTDFFKNVYFSNVFGTGADEPNEGNLGAEDIYGFDESDNDDDNDWLLPREHIICSLL